LNSRIGDRSWAVAVEGTSERFSPDD